MMPPETIRTTPFPTMPAVPAAYDHKRVTPEGRALGAELARLTETKVAEMAAAGEPDERCKTCAFRAGTVPNGCPQTLMDAVKCIVEQQPFYCHVNTYADGSESVCAGWLATHWGAGDRPPGRVPWNFTPADDAEPVPPNGGTSDSPLGGSTA
ncbi:hypothetical protein [Variovorax sp. J22G40]|nr:hypothetical protein [Variovorax sp. J22G40]